MSEIPEITGNFVSGDEDETPEVHPIKKSKPESHPVQISFIIDENYLPDTFNPDKIHNSQLNLSYELDEDEIKDLESDDVDRFITVVQNNSAQFVELAGIPAEYLDKTGIYLVNDDNSITEINSVQYDWDSIWMKEAVEISSHSKCSALHVGAVIVKGRSIVSTGINGTPSGYDNCSDLFRKINGQWYVAEPSDDNSFKRFVATEDHEAHHKWSETHEIHAEVNALAHLHIGHSDISEDDVTIYINHTPCTNCTKSILASGIKRVVVSNVYDGWDYNKKFLTENGVEVIEL